MTNILLITSLISLLSTSLSKVSDQAINRFLQRQIIDSLRALPPAFTIRLTLPLDFRSRSRGVFVHVRLRYFKAWRNLVNARQILCLRAGSIHIESINVLPPSFGKSICLEN